MSIFENIISAVKNVFSNKTRAVLTMLGIIIGIASVMAIMSIGTGSQRQITEQFESFGVGKLTVSNARNASRLADSDLLTMDDEEVIRSAGVVKFISATFSNSSATLKMPETTETKSAQITGVGEEYIYTTKPTLLYGRFFSDTDVTEKSKVVIINDTTALKLFDTADEALGEKITIKSWRGSQKFTVIGITENENASMEARFGDEYSEQLLMPVTTAMTLFNRNTVSNFEVIITDPNDADNATDAILNAIERKHGNQGEDRYNVQNMMTMMETINEMMGTITTLISVIAGISLIVGGVGVMNIMLVTVTERTREIGIRKSIGAKNSDIMLQFVIEALILTGTGGIIGIMAGWGLGRLVGQYMNVTAVLSAGSVALAVGISTAIGLIFGVYPANRAAKLDPIEALRFE